MARKKTVTHIKVFIASSGELSIEREATIKILSELTKRNPHLYLEPVTFEQDTESGNYPGKPRIQDKINPLLDESDIVVVIFFSKVGQFTREEFDRAISENKKVFLYLKEGNAPKNSIEIKLLAEVISLKEEIENESQIRYQSYNNTEQFTGLLERDIDKYLSNEYPINDSIAIGQSDKIEFLSSKNESSTRTGKTASEIAILYAKPIDKVFQTNEELLYDQLRNYRVSVDFWNLCIDNLNKVENHSIVFFFTHSHKNRFTIEDAYLKSKQCDFYDIVENIPSKNLKLVVVFHVGDVVSFAFKFKVPIVFSNISGKQTKEVKEIFTKFIYHVFKRSDLPLSKDFLIYGKENVRLDMFEKGGATKYKHMPSVSKFIDVKNLAKFVGRKTDVEVIIRKLIELKYETKLLTIKGSGGIGKTTIITKAVIEIAERGHYKSGIFFIPCQAINSYENFKYEVSLCFDLGSSINIEEQLNELSWDRDRLIILDNYETLLNISERDEIMKLLSIIADVACVTTTTRQLLELEYEDVYELRNFTTDEGLQLFKSIYNSFKVEEETILREDIIENILNNNPLAIKLIAKGLPANKDLLTLKRELEDNIFKDENIERIFERPEDINIEKSKSLYHSINYSYQKLNEREVLALDLLSLFPDGIHLENFKSFAKQSKENRLSIDDKDIKSLENKSLLENSNNFLKLQSIVSRFADYQFKKRNNEEKIGYYRMVIDYNKFLLSILGNRKFFKRSSSLKLMDFNSNNFLKALGLIEFSEYEQESILVFIDRVSDFFRMTNQNEHFLREIRKLLIYFHGNDFAIRVLNVISILTFYWTGDFYMSYNKLKSEFPLNEIVQLDLTNRLNKILYLDTCAIYDCEGFSVDILVNDISRKFYTINVLSRLCRVGYLNELSLILGQVDLVDQFDEFTFLETKYCLGLLKVDEADRIIKSLFKKQSLDILQCNYIKSKLVTIPINSIRKLVITNRYSSALVTIMEADNVEDIERKIEMYEDAIKRLEHIKYYKVETIYRLCLILEKIPDFNEKFIFWYKDGADLAKQYGFCYFIYLFDKLEMPELIYNQELYTNKYAPLGDGLKDFVKGYIRELKKGISSE